MNQRHDDPQFKFRMPSEMKARLEAIAKDQGRSLTAEILLRLDWTLEDGKSAFILSNPILGKIGDSYRIAAIGSDETNAVVTGEEAALITMYRTMTSQSQRAAFVVFDALSETSTQLDSHILSKVDEWGDDNDIPRSEAIERLVKRGLEASEKDHG